MRKLLFLFIIPFCLMGCKDQAKIDKQTIEAYISSHHLNAIAEPNGLYYVPTVTGSGPNPTATSYITVTYKGYYTDGTVFDQNTSGFSTYLNQVIEGWTEGIPLMKVGGKCTLLIPSALGYGSQGSGPVPGNTVIIFDIYLISAH